MDNGSSLTAVQGNGNVFEDLGFESEEALNLKIRADLMLDLRNYIQTSGWTQKEAATFLCETQSTVSDLMNGEIGQFSVDKLINFIGKIGMKIKIEVVSNAAELSR